MPDDWSWFWASEYGRDRMLRGEIEGLQASAYAASAQSARLSSQLRTLQGSIETRLQALSTAFDAYVELGDVREQLDGYPDTGAIRRDTLRALDTLADGAVPARVDARGVDYWLTDAVNEVVALYGGTEPPTVGPGGRSAEHETFVVAALGWLGRGPQVADRVPALLLGDGSLAAPQVVLWHAVVHGVYGDAGTGPIDAVRAQWERDLDLGAPTWDAVARETSHAPDAIGTLRWISTVLQGSWTPSRPADAGPPPDDRRDLRRLLDALVGAGLGDERALLERARVLRARIEDPGAAVAEHETEPPRTPTTDLVREALLDPEIPAGIRSALVAWVRPGLQAAAAQIAASVAAQQPGPTVVRTASGDIEVGTEGADPQRVAQLDAIAVQRWSTPRSRLLVPGISAAALLLISLLLADTSIAGLAVLLLLVAVVLLVLLGREVLRARTTRKELAGVRVQTQASIERGRETAVSVRSATLETQAEVASIARTIADAGSPSEATASR